MAISSAFTHYQIFSLPLLIKSIKRYKIFTMFYKIFEERPRVNNGELVNADLGGKSLFRRIPFEVATHAGSN